MENRQRTISPCVKNCCLDEHDICLGCFRSLTEITQWALETEEVRQQFLKNIAERKLKGKVSSENPNWI